MTQLRGIWPATAGLKGGWIATNTLVAIPRLVLHHNCRRHHSNPSISANIHRWATLYLLYSGFCERHGIVAWELKALILLNGLSGNLLCRKEPIVGGRWPIHQPCRTS